MSKKILSAFLFAALAAGCAADDKGEEDNPFTDLDKADSFANPTPHGTIPYNVRQIAAFSSNARFHSWNFTLTDDAAVDLATDIATPNLDTVMYLYRRAPGATSWGAFKFKNDDDGDLLSSRLTKNLGAGEYRVIVKA